LSSERNFAKKSVDAAVDHSDGNGAINAFFGEISLATKSISKNLLYNHSEQLNLERAGF